jgi:xanthine dehydrogenase YagS FAD-binding subunit
VNDFELSRADDIAAALRLMPAQDDAQRPVRFIAGGTNLVDLMKSQVLRPARLIDISRLPLDRIEATAGGGLMLGALVSNADTAYHPAVQARYPLLAASILSGASAQLRNVATIGGNLMQRTRCYYFYDVGAPCNKREPGSGCAALKGVNRMHAILGASPQCIAVHPSDMCVALAALQAVVHVESVRGRRMIPFAEFYLLPGDTPHIETTLAHDELIVGVELPPNKLAANSAFLKLRDRASYAFALVAVGAALEIDANGMICDARLALGGVAHRPWRDSAAEALLLAYRPGNALFAQVAEHVLRDARGYGRNNFKIPLARRAIMRALALASKLETHLEPGP